MGSAMRTRLWRGRTRLPGCPFEPCRQSKLRAAASVKDEPLRLGLLERERLAGLQNRHRRDIDLRQLLPPILHTASLELRQHEFPELVCNRIARERAHRLQVDLWVNQVLATQQLEKLICCP